MIKDIKEKWVTALRSGEYTQTRQCLRKGDTFCCLGVLSDIYISETDAAKWQRGNAYDEIRVLTWKQEPENEEDYEDRFEESELPKPVQRWADVDEFAMTTLMEMNDGQKDYTITELTTLKRPYTIPPQPFSVIADWIEENL